MVDGTRTRSASASRDSGLRGLRRLLAGADEHEAAELRTESEKLGALPITECCLGERVTVAGTVRAVTLRPHGGVPALEVELYDGSSTIHVVWLGRRRIAGIVTGAHLVVHGRVTAVGDVAMIYNPAYELRA